MNYRALYHLPKSIQHVSSVCRIDKIGTTPIRLGTNSSLQGSLSPSESQFSFSIFLGEGEGIHSWELRCSLTEIDL